MTTTTTTAAPCWHVGRNIAGYMPESDVTCFTDRAVAGVFLADEMREYADRDDDATLDALSDVPAEDYGTHDDGSPDYGDDAPSMRATVDAILKDDGPFTVPGDWSVWAEDGRGRRIVFWLALVPAGDCDHDGCEHD